MPTLQTLPEVAAALAELVGLILCERCSHPLGRHLDVYGCEHEHEEGPCGCQTDDPADANIVAVLKAHRALAANATPGEVVARVTREALG